MVEREDPKPPGTGTGTELSSDASGQFTEIPKEIESQWKISSNPGYSLETRLQAYEDIVDSEVGDTPLVRARNIEREIGVRQLYLKFEGGNPTGTQKDRIAFAQAMDALRRGFDSITAASCGNYGVSVALAASLAGLKCVIHIPEAYHTKRIKDILEVHGEIIRTPGDYERAIRISRRYARRHEFYDANPGGENTALHLRAYGEIAYEIYDELRDAPFVVAVPASNGTTPAGIFRGFLSLYRRGKTSRMPRIAVGSSTGQNPIIVAYKNNRPTCEDLRPEEIRETEINEPLINWHSADGDHALEAIRNSNGWAGSVSDKSMIAFSRLIREREGLHVLPASTAGLVALVEYHKKTPLPNDRYVAILTARK